MNRSVKTRVSKRLAMLVALGWVAFVVSGMAALAVGAPIASITGGADDTGQNYAWTITHDHVSPLIHVEFPHYRGGWAIPPKGWTANITNRGGAGGRTGRFTVTADDPSRGIVRGRSAEFRLTIVAEGTPRGEGDVLVRFADGSEVSVRAEVPVKESVRSRNVSLIGLGSIFGVFLLIRAFRQKRPKDAPGLPPMPPADQATSSKSGPGNVIC